MVSHVILCGMDMENGHQTEKSGGLTYRNGMASISGNGKVRFAWLITLYSYYKNLERVSKGFWI